MREGEIQGGRGREERGHGGDSIRREGRRGDMEE